VVDHDIVGLDITVHDALGVAEVEGLEELKDVETDVKVGEFGVESLELGVLRRLADHHEEGRGRRN
jgi:hypothetical protein